MHSEAWTASVWLVIIPLRKEEKKLTFLSMRYQLYRLRQY